MRSSKRDKDEIRAYVERQAHEQVVHLEKIASELVGPVRHNIWDVHCAESRWWVVSNPTNLYSQADFKSRDVVLTFHIDLMLRVEYAQERAVPIVLRRSCTSDSNKYIVKQHFHVQLWVIPERPPQARIVDLRAGALFSGR